MEAAGLDSRGLALRFGALAVLESQLLTRVRELGALAVAESQLLRELRRAPQN